MDQYDVVIIGAGVTGCAIARSLSRYKAKVLVVEKEEDVCSGTSKANSGIVHAGFDAMPGSMMAKMNVKGSSMMQELSQELDFNYINNGAMVLCFNEADKGKLEDLYDRGIQNGVQSLQIISGENARKREPAISKSVIAALWAPTSGIVCPFSITIALAENAAENGVEFRFLQEVNNIEKIGSGFSVKTNHGTFQTVNIVNAAGVYADKIHNMVSEIKLSITPRRGEYVLLDKDVGNLVHSTIFQLPGDNGKGVVVTPTTHGNLLIGPNAHEIDDRNDVETTRSGIEEVKTRAVMSVPDIPYNRMITSFAGLRAHEINGDFVIGEVDDCEGFFDAAGIESPGLSSAPAIGEYVAGMIASKYGYVEKEDFRSSRKGFINIDKLPKKELSYLIAKCPAYGKIVCRCENISEGQIIDAIRRTPGAKSMDGIKRRVRQGMGRCQAGFCTPKAMEILSRELGIPMEEINKNRPGSNLLKY